MATQLPVSPAGLQSAYSQLQTLKQQVMSGQLTLSNYQAQADPLVKQSQQIVQTIAGQGSNAANSVNPIWSQMQSEGFVSASGGKWVPNLPFSRQEYASLPNNVLPTADQISKGLFDPTTAPMQRTQTSSGGSTNQPVTGVTPVAPTGPGGQPLPQINPTLPPGIDTSTDQGKLALQGSQNAAQLQDALNKQYGVNQQAVSQFQQGIAGIPGLYTQMGQSQQDQLNALADQQKSARAQALTDLGATLAQNQMNQFNRAIPDLAEQANTAGIYRSTGFGNILAQKYANLTADTQTQLALQGISDRNTYLQAQQQALGANLGYQGQSVQAQAAGMQQGAAAGAGALQAYGAGLGDVANAQIGMQNAGLQRQFSLADYNTQYGNALNLANQTRVQGPTGKASPGTQAWMQGTGAVLNAATQTSGNGKGGGGVQSAPAGYNPGGSYAQTIAGLGY